jgi:Protein of unknown function (DUF3088)
MTDKLFLLNPNFTDERIDQNGVRYYCPHCALMEGILNYYPRLTERIEIHYVDFKKPRKDIIELIGEENQNCPVLIIDSDKEVSDNIAYHKAYNNKFFLNSIDTIVKYLSEKYGIGVSHP